MTLLHLYRTPALSAFQTEALLDIVKQQVTPGIREIETEHCFNIESSQPLDADQMRLLQWLLAETFEPGNFSDTSFLTPSLSLVPRPSIFEVGPRMNFTTASSTTACPNPPPPSRLQRSRRASSRNLFAWSRSGSRGGRRLLRSTGRWGSGSMTGTWTITRTCS